MPASIPLLYKGVAPGTHWYAKGDLTHPSSPGFVTGGGGAANRNAVITHVAGSSHPSLFLSCSLSFAVARNYAMVGANAIASQASPGWVYVISLDNCRPAGLPTPHVYNPVELLSKGAYVHAHTGDQDHVRDWTKVPAPMPRSCSQMGGYVHTPAASVELRALLFAIRDAELLVAGQIPSAALVRREAVY